MPKMCITIHAWFGPLTGFEPIILSLKVNFKFTMISIFTTLCCYTAFLRRRICLWNILLDPNEIRLTFSKPNNILEPRLEQIQPKDEQDQIMKPSPITYRCWSNKMQPHQSSTAWRLTKLGFLWRANLDILPDAPLCLFRNVHARQSENTCMGFPQI